MTGRVDTRAESVNAYRRDNSRRSGPIPWSTMDRSVPDCGHQDRLPASTGGHRETPWLVEPIALALLGLLILLAVSRLRRG